jgi:hypothetical protein
MKNNEKISNGVKDFSDLESKTETPEYRAVTFASTSRRQKRLQPKSIVWMLLQRITRMLEQVRTAIAGQR